MTILCETNRTARPPEEPILDRSVAGEGIHTKSIRRDTKGHSLHLSLNTASQLYVKEQ